MDFTDLEVYQLSEQLVLEIYKLTQQFPKEEAFGLTSQLRRAAMSIGANIAEGFGRYHSRGSLFEVKHFLLLTNKLKYISPKKLQELVITIDKLSLKLNNYIQSTRRLSLKQ